MESATVVLALGTSIIAVIATLLGSWLQHRFATSRAEAESREKRVRDAAAILGRIEILLSDGHPDRLGANVRPEEPFAALTPLRDDWHANLWPTLAAFSLAHESPEVRDVGRKLGVAVTNSLTASGWLLRDLVHLREGGDLMATRETANKEHAEAEALADRLMALVRGEPGGNKGATSPTETTRKEKLSSGPDSR